MRPTIWPALLLALLVAVVSISGCSDSGDDSGETAPPPAKAEDFPDPAGKTLAQIRKGLGPGPVLSPSVSLLEPGMNRVGFGLFDRARKQIVDAPAALYVAPVRGGGPVRGPFPARYESLEVKPQFQSEGVKADPDAASSVYVSNVRFSKPGDYELLAVVRLDNNLVGARNAVRVVKDGPVPDVGEPAIRVSTPTKADVGGDLAQIDTRVPPSTMHDVDLQDVLGKKPVMLIFATPALCQSRVCGPVVDIAEQVKASYDGDAEFIHMEIYKDNEFDKGFRDQVIAWHLPTEPWVFTIDRTGKVAARIEGAFSADELEAALAKAEK